VATPCAHPFDAPGMTASAGKTGSPTFSVERCWWSCRESNPFTKFALMSLGAGPPLLVSVPSADARVFTLFHDEGGPL
jgi:hypothetical protein